MKPKLVEEVKLPEKRVRKRKRNFSDTSEEEKRILNNAAILHRKTKKTDKKEQPGKKSASGKKKSMESSESNDSNTDSESESSSVSINKKNSNTERSRDIQAILDINKTAEKVIENNISGEDADKIDSNYNRQLFGEKCNESMVQLNQSGIFCMKRIYNITLLTSNSVTSMARRLMDGIFNPNEIKNCTLTGQSPRAHGKELLMKKYDPLDPMAVKAISDFAIAQGKERNWPIASIKEIKKAMTTKLRETILKNKN